jgi:hypothetical protein
MLSSHFIHIHVPKTGGKCIRTLCKHPQLYILEFNLTHLTLKESKQRLKELGVTHDVPSFCFVRNPWDWYLSRYCFRSQGTYDADDQYIPADHCGDGPEGFRKHMLILKDSISNGNCVRTIDGEPSGTRTYRPITLSEWHYKMVEGGTVKVGRFENFTQDAVDILNSLCPFISKDSLFKFFRVKVNESKHEHYRKYYDNELKKLVEKWDKRYIDEFGYSF